MSSGDKDMFCLSREMVEKDFREPFITVGYRKPGMKFTSCLKSIFLPYCNESFNVLSHGAYGLYFCAKFWNVFMQEFDITEPFVWPLLAYAMGTVGFCFTSSFAHTFNSMSPYWRRKCFYLDYAAISTYCFGYCQAFYFYCCPVDDTTLLNKLPKTFLAVSLLSSMICTFLNCVSTSIWPRFQYMIRVMVYASPFLLAASPLAYRLLFCTTKVDCDFRAFPFYLKECVFLVLATFAYASKIPERYVKETFDCLGQSHHLFHVLICVAADMKFEFIKAELLYRGESVEERMKHLTCYSLVLMFTALVLNLMICCFVNPTACNRTDEVKKKEE